MAGDEIAAAYLAILPSMKGMKKAIEAELDGVDAKGAGSRLGGRASSGFSSAFGPAVAAAAKAAAAALAAAGAAVGAVGAQALSSYAAYEQLVGGVDKLFGDASSKLQQYAAEAYKTSGMSANQYMEQATSFSASLVSSLGGDTAQAAELANVAMVAMSDNVNVFGSNMEDVQNAFQGFAKQNYTMLDNLKLGYGGTQEEMKRLVSDAAALTDVQGRLGLTVDANSMSFDNIVKAIQVMQTEMGIAGTTMDEAGKTIEGSVNMAKAAWSNWVAELGKDDADMAKLTDELVESIGTAAQNVVPRLGEIVGTAMASLPGLVAEVGPALAESLGSAVSAAYDTVKASVDPGGAFGGLFSAIDALAAQAQAVVDAWGSGANPVESFAAAASAALGLLLQDAARLASGIAESIRAGAGQVVGAALGMAASLAQGLADGLPEVAAAAGEVVAALGGAVGEALPELMENGLAMAEGLSESIREGAGTLVDAALGMAMNLAQGLADGIPSIIEHVPEIVSNIAGVINDNAPKVLETAVGIIWTLVQGLIGAIPTLVANIPQIVTAMVDAFLAFNWLSLGKDIIQFLVNGVKGMVSAAKSGAKDVFDRIVEVISQLPAKLRELGGNAIGKLKDAIVGKAAAVKDAAKGIFDKVVGEIKGLPDKALQVGRDLIDGLARGIKEAPGKLLSAITGAVGGVIGEAERLLGIASPSKVFRQIGEYTMQGMGLGISGAASGAAAAMDSAVRGVVGAAAVEVPGAFPAGGLAASGAAGAAVYNITLNADIRDFEGLRTLDDLYEMLARAKAMNPTRAA